MIAINSSTEFVNANGCTSSLQYWPAPSAQERQESKEEKDGAPGGTCAHAAPTGRGRMVSCRRVRGRGTRWRWRGCMSWLLRRDGSLTWRCWRERTSMAHEQRQACSAKMTMQLREERGPRADPNGDWLSGALFSWAHHGISDHLNWFTFLFSLCLTCALCVSP